MTPGRTPRKLSLPQQSDRNPTVPDAYERPIDCPLFYCANRRFLRRRLLGLKMHAAASAAKIISAHPAGGSEFPRTAGREKNTPTQRISAFQIDSRSSGELSPRFSAGQLQLLGHVLGAGPGERGNSFSVIRLSASAAAQCHLLVHNFRPGGDARRGKGRKQCNKDSRRALFLFRLREGKYNVSFMCRR